MGISRKMILDYEKSGLVKPCYVDKESGYRYFGIESIAYLQLVLDLRMADMPIKSIESFFNGKRSINEQIAECEEKIKHIEATIAQLKLRTLEKNTVSTPKEFMIPSQYCICKDVKARDISDSIDAFADLYLFCCKQKLKLDRKVVNCCHFPVDILSDNLYDTTDFEMKMCICVEPDDNIKDIEFFPEVKGVYVTYCGSYENGLLAYESIKKYIIEHNLTPIGNPREYYYIGSFDNEHNDNVVLVTVPIE